MASSPSEPLVRRIDRDGVAVVEMNRPARRNAITGPMLDALTEQVTAVAADPSIAAMVFCGADGAFCSGLDLTEYNADPRPDWLATSADSLRAAHVALATCPVPVVVALERYAINGGAALALAGDVIVVGRESWLQVGEVRLGMAAPNNLAWLLARYPLSTALRLTLTGERVGGQRLYDMNIAHEIVDDDQVRPRAEALATELAGFPDGATRLLKETTLRVAGFDDAQAWFERASKVGGMPDGKRVIPPAR